jgi:triphosphoribosyl-dephospho-CoA synthase
MAAATVILSQAGPGSQEISHPPSGRRFNRTIGIEDGETRVVEIRPAMAGAVFREAYWRYCRRRMDPIAMKERARRIAQLAQVACVLEACAPKPGNVNRAHDFTDAALEDFLISAIAIGPALESAAETGVGRAVRQGIEDTRRWTESNTNLGLLLLLTPLVKACLSVPSPAVAAGVRRSLIGVLHSLTVEDTRLAYAAIRLARPAGMGRVPHADVSEEPGITLLQAMELARDRDAVAREYVTGFEITFETGLPALRDARSRGADFPGAVVQTFLAILSRVPDTLICRKRGSDIAAGISGRAGEILMRGGVFTPEGREALAEMDASLRDEGHTLNPGTTADLTAAAVFLFLFETASVNDAKPAGGLRPLKSRAGYDS